MFSALSACTRVLAASSGVANLDWVGVLEQDGPISKIATASAGIK
jgi:hypothetical protein